MKKTISLLLALCLTVSLLCGAVGAEAAETENEAVFAARAMGIMTGGQNGNMNLSANVTRAEFAKMMVAASKYKDGVGTGVGVSLYKDVKSNHWASQYIKIAVEEGWFQGYVDGSFRPSGAITVEEGATVVLRALGYGAGDLMGAFPSAQLSKYAALGLSDGIAKTQGQQLSRQDCAQLFYNLMGTKNTAGQYYGSTLGYKVDGDGNINYSALVNANMKGPYLAENGGGGIPISSPTVIKNGKTISQSKIAKYDVYYYNAGMGTVWVYDDKAVGTISAISPNTAAPESVTVGGVSYALSTSDSMFAVSDTGSYRCGDTVTLLLDRNGAAAFVTGAENISAMLYGVVLSCTQQTVTTSGTSVLVYTAKIACTDGVERTVNSQYQKPAVGAIVSVKYDKGETTINSVSNRSISGKFTSDSFGGKKFAPDVEILDVCGTNYMRVYPERLSGYSVSDSAVSFYELNGSGEISKLILKNATGDAAVYGFVTSVNESQGSDSFTSHGEYSYFVNGTLVTANTNGFMGGAVWGGVRVNYTDGKASSFTGLKSYSASTLTQLQAVTSGSTYKFADGVQVYINRGSDYQPASVSGVMDSSNYSYTIWVDTDAPAGGRVRVLIAKEI